MRQDKINELRYAQAASSARQPPRRQLSVLWPIAVTVLAVGAYVVASAHGGATGIVKERMDAMSELKDATKIISDMVKRKRPMDPEQVTVLAELMSRHAVRIPELFPDTEFSRNGAATEALPAVWERRQEFDQLAAELADGSDALAEAGKSGDSKHIRKQFVKVAKNCRSCHTDFRKKKKKT